MYFDYKNIYILDDWKKKMKILSPVLGASGYYS